MRRPGRKELDEEPAESGERKIGSVGHRKRHGEPAASVDWLASIRRAGSNRSTETLTPYWSRLLSFCLYLALSHSCLVRFPCFCLCLDRWRSLASKNDRGTGTSETPSRTEDGEVRESGTKEGGGGRGKTRRGIDERAYGT